MRPRSQYYRELSSVLSLYRQEKMSLFLSNLNCLFDSIRFKQPKQIQNEGSKSASEFVHCLQFTNWQVVRLHQQLKMLLINIIHQSMQDKIININTSNIFL